MRPALLILISAALFAIISAKWTVLCADGECPSVMTDIAPTPVGSGKYSACMVGGDSSSQDPDRMIGLWCAKNENLDDFTRLKHVNASVMQIAMAVSPAATVATTGVGFLNYTTHIMYSLDRRTAYNAETRFNCVGQDIKSILSEHPTPADKQLFAQVGTTNMTTGTQGLLLSGDSGQTFSVMEWDASITYGNARYVSGFSASSAPYIFVSGGTWPGSASIENELADLDHRCLRMSKKLCLPAPSSMTREQIRLTNAQVYSPLKKSISSLQPGGNGGYYGVLTLTKDLGKTWTKLFETDEFYFNDIHCIDQFHCVVVGEADNTAYAYVSFDSGKTWTKSLQLDSKMFVSLFRVRFLTPAVVFITGGIFVDETSTFEGRIYKSIDGGKTWDIETKLPDVAIIMGINFSPDGRVGFAVGSTQSNESIVARYDAV